MRTHEQWQEIFKEQRESGLKQKEFCALKGISIKTFSARKSRIKHLPSAGDKKTSKFIRVKREKPNNVLNGEIHLHIRTKSGEQIEFGLSSLKSVLRELNSMTKAALL